MHFPKRDLNISNSSLPDTWEVLQGVGVGGNALLLDLGWGRGKYFFCKVRGRFIVKDEVSGGICRILDPGQIQVEQFGKRCR